MIDDIDVLRQRVEDCDYEIMRVLRERLNLTSAIGDIKKAADLPVEASDIEQQKINNLSSYGDWLTEGEVGVIFSSIIKVSRTRQYFDRIKD